MDQPLRVLLAEDNPGDAFLIAELLGGDGSYHFEPTSVSRLEEALDRATETDFDVVLLDLGLPDSSGLDTFRTIHSRFPQVPVVVMTGNEDELLGLAGIREGAQDYVMKKDIGPALLHRVLRYATERHQVLEHLRESEERLRQAQKMEAVGQLAGGIAHDFNNLMMAIIGYSDLLLSTEQARNPDLRSDLSQIKKAAERASELTRQMLAFSRRQPLQPTLASINAVVEKMAPLLRPTLCEDITLVTELSPQAGLTEVDVNLFEQAIMNIALNARDAMPSGGRLCFRTWNAELDAGWCKAHVDARPGSYVALEVSDTGTGMDADTKSRIFEPFFTTKLPGQGTGLGLSMVYGIVTQSGGAIDVQSEPNRGTTIVLYLPRLERPETVTSESPDETLQRDGGETLLVVEDEPALRTLIDRILAGLGYSVVTASEASEALAVLDKGGHTFDLLLTDVVLPGGMQGRELAERAVQMQPHLPVVYMSGFTRDTIVRSGRLEGRVNLLEKPFTSEVLARTVRAALEQSHRGKRPSCQA